VSVEGWPAFDDASLPPGEGAKAVLAAQLADIGAERKGTLDDKAAAEKAQQSTFDAWATANRNADIANLAALTRP